MNFSAALLAGGRSRRMGREKVSLPVEGYASLLERQLSVLAALEPAEIIVSCRPDQDLQVAPGARCVFDDGTCGPLGGIAATLRATRADLVLFLAIDLGRITPKMLKQIAEAASSDGFHGVVPRTPQRIEPLAALLPRTLLPFATAQLAARDELSMCQLIQTGVDAGLLGWLDVPACDAPLFANWNRPGDLP
jgi:molybdenum cofactor guanylyltransferase